MSLKDEVYAIVQTLAPAGWQTLFNKLTNNDVDLIQDNADALESELLKKLAHIDRSISGFQDFNPLGEACIEPGSPDRSLLYHALASPSVLQNGEGGALTVFPTLQQLETVENYLYALAKKSLLDLSSQYGGVSKLYIAVFAYEYRPGATSVSKKFAGMAYSRTGVARVGTQEAAYVPSKRGFVPWVDEEAAKELKRVPPTCDEGNVLRVIPCRFAPFLAIRLKANKRNRKAGRFFGPMDKNYLQIGSRHFDTLPIAPYDDRDLPNDSFLDFYVPVHKLFNGTECLMDFADESGLALEVNLELINDKLQRAFRFLADGLYSTGWGEGTFDLKGFPFEIRNADLGAFSTDADMGGMVLVPKAQALVSPAQGKRKGDPDASDIPFTVDATAYAKALTVKFPHESWSAEESLLGPSWNLVADPGTGGRSGPEYLNVRNRLDPDPANLNTLTEEDIIDTLLTTSFKAQTYFDYSADGYVSVSSDQIAEKLGLDTDVPRYNDGEPLGVAAYSLIAAPNFLPYVRQRDILDWTFDLAAASGIRTLPHLLWDVMPWALSDDRISANLNLPDSPFTETDLTVSAVVGAVGPDPKKLPEPSAINPGARRETGLPDAAAGSFAPGWDVSYDTGAKGNSFLANYGLGSPFAEDAMICSALGSFWPTVSPDTTRVYAILPSDINWRTVAPLTDKEIGVGAGTPSWDGTPPPRLIQIGGTPVMVYRNFDYNDYTQNALADRFSIANLQKITMRDFEARTLAIYHAYVAVGVTSKRVEVFSKGAARWAVLNFVEVEEIPSEVVMGAAIFPNTLKGPFFLITMHRPIEGLRINPVGGNYSEVQVPINNQKRLYAYTGGILIQKPGGDWENKPMNP